MVSSIYRVAALVLFVSLLVAFPPQPTAHQGRLDTPQPDGGHRIYVAFGFHANLYHSYRLDDNTEAGFGKDIRVMRTILSTLDDFNRRGVPVKGVWDMDNLFTLEKLLPRYAPDVIDDIRRRLTGNGDEMIVMSYNNALASAQTPEEFRASIEMAMTNRNRSGLKDVFPNVSPIVRPQEMMITPGDFHLYQEMGIKAVTLYYSAITFDAFRMFVPPLSLEEGFNPLTYKNRQTGESMTVIPAYTIGDLLENVSLGHLVHKLREQQVSGEIDRDLLVFINFDADDSYWEGYDLPWHLSWLPNTGGLKALVEEVAGLEYVSFTTLSDYLDTHEPVGELSFSQDTADGNFNGYNSWAEKATSSQYWTKVVESRRRQTAIEKMIQSVGPQKRPAGLETALSNAFDTRLALLSTTNYGMAAPFVTPERERVVEAMIRRSDDYLDQAWDRARRLIDDGSGLLGPIPGPVPGSRYLDTLTIFGGRRGDPNIAGGAIRIQAPAGLSGPDRDYYLTASSGDVVPLRLIGRVTPPGEQTVDLTLFIPSGREASEGVYRLYAAPAGSVWSPGDDSAVFASETILKNEYVELTISDEGYVAGLEFRGKSISDRAGLLPNVVYGPPDHRQRFGPRQVQVSVENSGRGGVAALRIQGDLPLAGDRFLQSGRFDYRFTLMAGEPVLLVEGEIQYPETRPEGLLSSGHAALVKKYDPWWYETAPLEWNLDLKADRDHPFKVLKRNYLGVESSYDIDYFRHSDANLSLADVNNHITAEYVGVAGRGQGVAVAMDDSVYANFAFCPLKVDYSPGRDAGITMNPFGTYFGRQYVPPTWGNRQGYQAALLAGGQYCSSAPSFNGAYHPFSLAFTAFEGDDLPEAARRFLVRFAHPPVVMTRKVRTWSPDLRPATGPKRPQGLVTASENGGVYVHWDASRDKTSEYRIRFGTKPGRYDGEYISRDNSIFIDTLDNGRRYYATVAGLDDQGRAGPEADEISFVAGKPAPAADIDLPVSFQVRVMLSSIFR